MAGYIVMFGFANGGGNGFLGGLYILRPERFEIAQTRNPSIIGLPNQNASNRGAPEGSRGTGVPKNLAIDFGMMEENIVIEGKVSDEDQSDVNQNLELFIRQFRTSWVNMPTVISANDPPDGKGLVKVRLFGGNQSYDMTWGCVPIRTSFSRSGGQGWWDYRITLGVVRYPEQTTGMNP